ncbi:MAG: hypothetical protein J0L63_02180 [Anaerolineae bacterium]|nr:hypothetical protein [Anaerolineae bacterium]
MSAATTTTTTNAPLGGNLAFFPPLFSAALLPLLLQNRCGVGLMTYNVPLLGTRMPMPLPPMTPVQPISPLRREPLPVTLAYSRRISPPRRRRRRQPPRA